jgi:hypothetical protein
MNDTKPWYTSKTVWASLATILVSILGIFKRSVDPHFVDDFSSWAVSASTLIALYGRLKATSKIASPAPPSSGLKILTVLCGSALLTTIAGCAAPNTAFVQAERSTYNAIAPEYSAYVETDGSLTSDQKTRRQRTLQTWDLSLRQQEGSPSSRPNSN